MCSSMKELTRCRISLMSGVIAKSAIFFSLSGRELLKPGKALFSLLRRVSDCRNDIHDRCGYAVFAIGLDLPPARRWTAIDEYLFDYLRGHQTNRLLTLSVLPGLHHRSKRVTAAEPFVEGVVIRSR